MAYRTEKVLLRQIFSAAPLFKYDTPVLCKRRLLQHRIVLHDNHNTMAAVYKSLSKSSAQKGDAPASRVKKNKQRVLILSSRGVTYR
jgi:ribosome biogenesis protein BRX1